MPGLKKHFVLGLFGIVILSVWIDAAQNRGAGQTPAGQAPAGQRAGRGQRGAQDGPPPITGLTVTGEVPNYVPVTDAMLSNPDPGD